MINIRMQNKDVKKLTPKITVIGVGGAGGNAVNNMISSGLQGAGFVVCNTDAQALEGSLCDTKIQLGVAVTGGLGAGAKPDIGRAAAEESLEEVLQYLEGSNMAFITAGMGGGTGTGAAPVIARACREKGILTVGVVTKPFHFEGTSRMRMAEAGIQEMQDFVDTLIVIPNQNLFRIANEKTTFSEAFRMADSVLQSGVRGVTDLMIMPGLINLDFADIRSAMLEMGKAMMGTGEAAGDRRAIEAAEKAINNPLLDDVSMKGARGVIINVTGGYDMTLFEVDEACNRIRDEVDPNANIIFGSTFEEALEGVMRVSVVATGIDVAEAKARRPSATNTTAAINALTAQQHQQQERRFERVQPNTGAQQFAEAPVQAPVQAAAPAPIISRAAVSGMTVPAATLPLNIRPAPSPYANAGMASAATGSAARKIEEPEAVPAYHYQEQPVEPVRRPEENMRGMVQGDAFIPPRPMEGGYNRTVESAYGSPMGSLSARRMAGEAPAQPTVNPGLNLKPPVPASNVAPRKRTQTLFERFTSPLRHHGEQHEEGSAGEAQGSATGGNTGGFVPPLQGSLNIDAPKTDNVDSELDIPAFLRRQAN